MTDDGIGTSDTLRAFDVGTLQHGAELRDVLAALFGSEAAEEIEPPQIGRYRVERRLGAGGMGAVYEAFDPNLERQVAIKVLHGDGVDDERLLAEGKAMAKLNHPNVVTVYDVDRDEDRVFVAMELVPGTTLRAWQQERPRKWRETVALYLDIGRGIAAAHAEDLVHCDLKPDNVLVGEDGRPRVADFGIALLAGNLRDDPDDTDDADPLRPRTVTRRASAPSSLGGTPQYMSPEQFLREPLDHRSDQFSLCAMLWEALYGQRPFEGNNVLVLAANVTAGELRPPPPGRRVPAWLRKACERGMSVDPKDRWPSVEALLTELERGQAQTRRRVVLGSLGAVAVVVASVAVGARIDRARRIAACDDAAAQIGEVWNDSRAEAVRQALRATKLEHAEFTAQRIGPWLNAQATAWSDARREACLQHEVRGQWDADLYMRSTWCLDNASVAMQLRIAELAGASSQTVSRAASIASPRDDVSACLDRHRLQLMPVPDAALRPAIAEAQRDLAAASAAIEAGRYTEARDAIVDALPELDGLSWPPLRATALFHLGRTLVELGDTDSAHEHYMDAYFVAMRNGAPAIALRAAGGLMFAEGFEAAKPEEGLVWARHGEVLLDRLEAHEDTIGADFLVRRGHVQRGAGRYDAAQADYERALQIYRDTWGESHPAVTVTRAYLGSLARGEGKYDEAIEIGRRVLDEEIERLGPQHPGVADRYSEVAVAFAMAGRPSEGIPMLETSIAIKQAAQLDQSPSFASDLATLGGMYDTLGESDKARAMHERSLSILEATVGPNHPRIAITLNNLANAIKRDGEDAEVEPLLRRALEILEKNEAPTFQRAVVMYNLADVNAAMGRVDRARELYEGSLRFARAGARSRASAVGDADDRPGAPCRRSRPGPGGAALGSERAGDLRARGWQPRGVRALGAARGGPALERGADPLAGPGRGTAGPRCIGGNGRRRRGAGRIAGRVASRAPPARGRETDPPVA